HRRRARRDAPRALRTAGGARRPSRGSCGRQQRNAPYTGPARAVERARPGDPRGAVTHPSRSGRAGGRRRARLARNRSRNAPVAPARATSTCQFADCPIRRSDMTFWTEALGAEVRYYDAGGIRTRVLEAGTGDPVVMIHGLSGHAETFIRNVVPLAEAGYHAYAI